MNKLIKTVVACLSLATLLSSCGGAKDKTGNKAKTVDCTVMEFFENYKNKNNKSTKYHMIGVQPYSFKRGDGTNYSNDSYYFFFDANGDSSRFIAGRVVSQRSYYYDETAGEYCISGEYNQAEEFENNSQFKEATKEWTFEINLFLLRMDNSSSNYAVEILNATAPSA